MIFEKISKQAILTIIYVDTQDICFSISRSLKDPILNHLLFYASLETIYE